MLNNVLIQTARAVFDPGTGATTPPEPLISESIPAHMEFIPISNRVTLRQAGIMAKLWCSVDGDEDVLPGDEIIMVTDIFDESLQWPASIFGPLGLGQKTWTVTNVIPSPNTLLQQRLVYIDSDTTGGPEELG